jgi:oligoendopeptidase F
MPIPISEPMAEFMQMDWPEILPLYEELSEGCLDEGDLEEWLARWTWLADLLEERLNRHYVATAVDTADREAETEYTFFLDTVLPAARSAEQKLKQKLLASGLQPDGFSIPLRNMRAESELFREENQLLLSEELHLGTEYDRLVGAQTVRWEGEEKTVAQLHGLLEERDRGLRERAWRAAVSRQMADRDLLDGIWRRLLDIRLALARNAGFGGYRDFRWRQLLRFDYTPDDCLRFHAAIAEVVVPAVEKLNESRRARLGLSTLRPWDLGVDPAAEPPLRPFVTAGELEEKAAATLRAVAPELGEQFDTMRRERLLDIENRKSKAPGGFSLDLPVAGRPFIFANAVGSQVDVQTLLHEAGHAFHTFATVRLPYSQQRVLPMEFSEVASMAMEFLALPHLARAGFYSPREAARARLGHLKSSLRFWPYMAIVDAFQHWVYEHPEQAREPAGCEAAWEALSDRFLPGIDWSGLEAERRNGWRTRLHIFRDAFYYVEYGLAQLGAVQIWARSLQDPVGAVEDYRRALALGGTASLPELYRAAGARLAFDEEALAGAVALIEKTTAELERQGNSP